MQTKEGSSQMTITAHLLIHSLHYGSVSATAYRDCQQGCCISHVRLLETEILCAELILKRMHYYITCIKSSALFALLFFSLSFSHKLGLQEIKKKKTFFLTWTNDSPLDISLHAMTILLYRCCTTWGFLIFFLSVN